MDKSYDASKSEGSSEEEWMDLSKSDYAKVIFSGLYWNSESGDVGCYFVLTETVIKNPLDYIGIYKVGYDSLSQCLAMKKLSEIKCEDDSKPIHCCFKSEELPELNGFYQFLYITHLEEVCGASMPCEVKHTPRKTSSVEEVVTERIENDFLMVRYGLEEKNHKLETLLETYQAENSILVSKIKELRAVKLALTHKCETTQQTLNTTMEENEQLIKRQKVLAEELELVKAKEAAAAKDYNSISSELENVRKQESELLHHVKKAEEVYENAIGDYKARIVEFEINMKENEASISELHKIIEELKKDINCKQILIDNIKQEHSEWNESQELIFAKYVENIDQLYVEKLKLKGELEILLQKLQKREKENSVSMVNKVSPTANEQIAAEQLEDAKFMIKALEDSKQLAMKEMHELSEKLNKTVKELGELRCENMALKMVLDDKKSWDNLISKMRESDPTVDIDNLETKVMDLIKNAQQQTEEINKLKTEFSMSKCENMALKFFLEENASSSPSEGSKQNQILEKKNVEHPGKDVNKLLNNIFSKLKVLDPFINVNNAEESVDEIIENVYKLADKIKKLEEECKRNNEDIKILNERIDFQSSNLRRTVIDAADKTARIVKAAELYKDLYVEKEKLAKQLKKLMLMKSRSKKSLASKFQDNSQTSFLPLNIETSPTCSESTSNNSDSDTGEHVRTQILYPDLKQDENYISASPLPQPVVINEAGVQSCCECDYLDIATNNLCVDGKDDQVCKAPSKVDSLISLQPLSVEQDTQIPCIICGKLYLVTPHSNIPMMEHIEKEHNMSLCPVCGQMFDKSFPPQYLTFHINDHFKPE